MGLPRSRACPAEKPHFFQSTERHAKARRSNLKNTRGLSDGIAISNGKTPKHYHSQKYSHGFFCPLFLPAILCCRRSRSGRVDGDTGSWEPMLVPHRSQKMASPRVPMLAVTLFMTGLSKSQKRHTTSDNSFSAVAKHNFATKEVCSVF